MLYAARTMHALQTPALSGAQCPAGLWGRYKTMPFHKLVEALLALSPNAGASASVSASAGDTRL